MLIDRLLPGFVLTSLLCSFACGSSRPPQAPPDDTLVSIPDDAPTNASSCDDRLDFARSTMARLVDAANGSCSTDAECTLVFAETQCLGACQAPILADRLGAFRDAQAAIDDRVCTDYVESGCIYATPACLAVEAVCQAGRCALMPQGEAQQQQAQQQQAQQQQAQQQQAQPSQPKQGG